MVIFKRISEKNDAITNVLFFLTLLFCKLFSLTFITTKDKHLEIKFYERNQVDDKIPPSKINRDKEKNN